ncbi:hypothetical protein STCU_11150 [Strigomonas culicis]|uniref:Uncharacterized protein n=1 Tax=Strigomonas culicis TaxID=28005 RepID=S9TJL7_9TRYP|nr:hypothetical protein STCU_11150 [Strigomonas culicis]|eukprot:EPY16548.1 hypothetical protein STCU_11150 [Strigomonas culicis]
MNSENQLCSSEGLRGGVAVVKCAVDCITQYSISEATHLMTCGHPDLGRVNLFVFFLLLLYQMIFSLQDQQEKKHPNGERTMLPQCKLVMAQFENLLKQWFASNPLEKRRTLCVIQTNSELTSLQAEVIVQTQAFRTLSVFPKHVDDVIQPAGSIQCLGSPQGTCTNSAGEWTAEANAVDTSPCLLDMSSFTETYLFQQQHEQNDAHASRLAHHLPTPHYEPRREAAYPREEWEDRLRKVGRCSSIGELLRYILGTDHFPFHTALEPTELSALVSLRQLHTSTRLSPLWRCTITLPITKTNESVFGDTLPDDCTSYCVAQTKSYPTKQKSKQIAFFHAAFHLFPDKTAHYCSLLRSDVQIAAEAKESLFDFTDCSQPFTLQLVNEVGEERGIAVEWSVEQMFSSVEATAPEKYVAVVKCGLKTFTFESNLSVVSAFMGAMEKAETAQRLEPGHKTVAMWADFLELKPPVMNKGQELIFYLFNHFFGVPKDTESALVVDDQQEGTAWRSTLRLYYSPQLADTVTVATAVGVSKKAAQELALQYAAAFNFHDVFARLAEADPSKTNKVLVQYAREVTESFLELK